MDAPSAHRDPGAQLLGERLRPEGGPVDETELRPLPRHDVEPPRAAAHHRDPFASALRVARALVLDGAEIEDLGPGRGLPHRRVRMEADEQVGAVVVGDGRALVEGHVDVARAGEHDAQPEPSLDGGLQPTGDAQGDVLLQRALGAEGPHVGPSVSRVDGDGADRRRLREVRQGGQPRLLLFDACLRLHRGTRVGRRRGGGAGLRRRSEVDDHLQAAAEAGRAVGGEAAEAAAQLGFEPGAPVVDRHPPEQIVGREVAQDEIHGIGLEGDEKLPGRPFDAGFDVRGHHEAQPRPPPDALIAAHHLRDAHVTDDHQPRAGPQFDRLVRDEGKRPSDEVGRHVPDASALHRGRAQRLEPPRHRHDAVSRRQHHHRRSPHERQPAGLPVVAHAQAEGPQELGQGDHGAAADVDGGKGAPAIPRDDRQTVRGGLTAAGEGGGEHDAQRPSDAARTSRPDARPSLDRGQGAWRRGHGSAG